MEFTLIIKGWFTPNYKNCKKFSDLYDWRLIAVLPAVSIVFHTILYQDSLDIRIARTTMQSMGCCCNHKDSLRLFSFGVNHL